MSQFGTLKKSTISIPSGSEFSIRAIGSTPGYDGHCLRAYTYWPEKFPDIVNTVESINSIKKLYEPERSGSKAPTFLLTYAGTYKGLMNNCGFPEEEARGIEDNFKDLYKVSIQWVQDKLDEASQTGYVELAFGLRLRTPLLAKVIRGSRNVPYQAEAEGRTAGNALGQSYGLLNNRAMMEFMQRVRCSKYRNDIKPCAMIHDAIYLVIRNRVDVVHWVNENLIDCMQWQDLPDIRHDKVKLGAELDVFWPTWASPMTLPNGTSEREFPELCTTHLEALNKKEDSQ